MLRDSSMTREIWWTTRSRGFEVALEVHLRSVPYGLVMFRRRLFGERPRHHS